MLIKDQKYFLLKITSIFNVFIFAGLFLLVAIVKPFTLNHFFSIYPIFGSWQYYSLKIFLVLFLVLFLVVSILWVLISFKKKWTVLIEDNIFLCLFLTILTINFYGAFFVGKFFYNQKKQNFNIIGFWAKFKTILGIKQWVTIDYVLIAFFCALTLIFGYIEENLLPRMPFGGGIALKYIPLFIISFTTSFLGGWLTGFCSSLMFLLFIPTGNIVSPWSFILDYFLPMTSPAIIAFLPFKKNDKSIFTYIIYFLHCFLVFLLIFCWQFLSGYFIWITVFPDSVWKGFDAILYSLVYNFIHIFLFTYPITQFIVPLLYRNFKNYHIH